jgi:nucleotide-binding universal stress UspA family protein
MHTDRQMPLDSGPNGGRRPPDGPVICAIDDDGLAEDVMATGAALAQRLDVPLTVVHSPYPNVFLTGEARRLALERGNALVDQVTHGHRFDERVVEVDDPARLISAVAAEGASLIVLGTRGRTGLRAAILGSVSHAVIASAPCPVVTVSDAVEIARGATGHGALSERVAA